LYYNEIVMTFKTNRCEAVVYLEEKTLIFRVKSVGIEAEKRT